MLIKHQLRSNFFIISGFHPLFDKEPKFLKVLTLFFYYLQKIFLSKITILHIFYTLLSLFIKLIININTIVR